ncbi:MAG: DUF4190 domain-containing protein [Verrucomicrobia bacterium]|nr:DUF4190 domain-containing protein [Verrucomicrobiota bacterium]
MNSVPSFPPPPLPPLPRRSQLAVASLVLGILGLVLCGLTGIPAVICAHMARSRIRRAGGAASGDGLAITGLITGYFAIGLSLIILLLLSAVAMPNFTRARHTAQHGSCTVNLRLIAGAKATWALEHNKGPADVPTDSDLFGADSYIRDKPRCPAGGTYSLNPVSKKPTCSVPGHAY